MDTQIFSKKYLVIPVCDGRHWILVIVKTVPNISLMILDSLNKQQKTVERRITRYLRDMWQLAHHRAEEDRKHWK